MSINCDSVTLIDFQEKRQLRQKYYYKWPCVTIHPEHPKLLGLLFQPSNTNRNCIRSSDTSEIQSFANDYKLSDESAYGQKSGHVIWVEMSSKYNKDLFTVGLKTFLCKNQMAL